VSTATLTIHGASARRGREIVARFRFAGKVITVADTSNHALGRLIPVGYLQGSLDDPDSFDVWTAKHPVVHTPSDTELAYGMTMTEAVGFLLGL
jgi:hypothetical protein